MRKPRCYTVNTKPLDMSAATVYGDIVQLYENGPVNYHNPGAMAHHLKIKLKDAISSDYLICSGNVLLNIIAFSILYEQHGLVNLLLYDIRTSTYTPRVLFRHQLEGGKNV